MSRRCPTCKRGEQQTTFTRAKRQCRECQADYRQRRRERMQNADPVDREGSWRLPAGPFAEWLRSIEPAFDGHREMQIATDVDDAAISRLLKGTQHIVQLDTVDRAGCRLGDPDLLKRLYPLLWARSGNPYSKRAAA